MAGATKAVLASLMFALLLSASIVDAARPMVATEGGAVATDGTLMARDPHSRQLRLFFGCGFFFRWACRPRFVPVIVQQPVFVPAPVPVPVPAPEEEEDYYKGRGRGNGRRLNFFLWGKCWWWGCGHGKFDHGYGGYGYYGGWWGRRLSGDDKFYGRKWFGFKRFFHWF